MSETSGLTIGKLASRSDVTVQTIRYYERNGILPKPARTTSGYRIYSERAVRTLSFIKHAQLLGFTLSEIQELLSLRRQPDTSCENIRQRACQKILDVKNKIERLQRIQGALTKLIEECPGDGPPSECRLVEALENGKSQQLI